MSDEFETYIIYLNSYRMIQQKSTIQLIRPSSKTRKNMNEEETPSISGQRINKRKDEVDSYDIQMLDATQTGKLLSVKGHNYNKYQVPIVKITKKTSKVTLVPKSKGQEEAFPYIVAKGRLLDTSNAKSGLQGKIDFQGNFKGVFEKEEAIGRNQIVYYFEGEITHLKIININGVSPTNEQAEHFKNLTRIRGYFKGVFAPITVLDQPGFINDFNLNKQQDLHKQIVKQQGNSVEYHVPTLVRMEIHKIKQINLKKSSAQISAILKIDIQLNEETLRLIYDQKEKKFKDKYKLTIDFHRGKPYVLPFYDPNDFAQTDEEVQYEWDDVWEGIYLQVEWNKQLMRFSYRIQTIYTAQIDNSHGIFYAPFNLNILKIVIDFHSIKIQKNVKICINCCDLTDFNTSKYSPYTYFQDLQRNLVDKDNYEQIYEKHIDRLTKIDTTHFVDQGEFKVANNRLCLFPYHKRIFKNKNEITSDTSWTIGLSNKNSLLQTPQVTGIKDNYSLNQNNKLSIFELDQWEFVHIEIPIFKYPVIDMIRIFVPITILSAISMTIFWQENANDFGGFTELAKRIASGCSLMIAYVALIPMIRENLPPTPSVTLIEILIYLSVIPNFLAICSVFITTGMDTDQFFRTYKPFTDPLFLISFVICCLSLIILSVMMIVYALKDYKSDYTIYKFKPSPLRNLRAPTFLSYIQKIRKLRPQFIVEQLEIPYNQFEEVQEQSFS